MFVCHDAAVDFHLVKRYLERNGIHFTPFTTATPPADLWLIFYQLHTDFTTHQGKKSHYSGGGRSPIAHGLGTQDSWIHSSGTHTLKRHRHRVAALPLNPYRSGVAP